MDKNTFDAVFPLQVQALISLLRQQEHFSLMESLRYLYNSQLYSALEQEETKAWHYSPMMLFQILRHEKQTGQLQFPNLV